MAGLGQLGGNASSKSGYEWVKDAVWCISSKFVDAEGVRHLGPLSSWVREGEEINIEFLRCALSERVCHKGPSGGWFFMYTCVLSEIGVRFPFTPFECAVLRQINCAPSQIHSNSWGFMRALEILMEYLEEKPSVEVFFHLFQAKGVDRGMWVTLSSHQGRTVFCPFKASYKDFKEFYIKVRSAEDSFPFYLDNHLAEKFPLYWNKRPVQCLGVEELLDKDADLVEFLFQNLKGGKVLTTSELLKWDSEESVIDYLESKVPNCNTSSLKSFFKQRVEKEVSSSHVVKVEKGSEVRKLLERRRPVSLKRMRSEEAFGKKVIDLTGSRCHGKDLSVEEAVNFTKSQEGLQGFSAVEDLNSLWCQQYPFASVADEHFRSKVDLEMLGKVGKVEAARLLCIGREWEMQAMEEEGTKEDKRAELIEVEKNLKLAREQVTLKERENALLEKEAKVSKKADGFEMFAAAWDRAKAQIELFVPGVDLDKMDPVKVVYKGELVDDDQVSAEGSDDHNPGE
ncbi:hypothetical protein PIB30_056731 [Stylosanthes scabra]|uniref:Transposase (putative) gypsy type domain-containing protein n=1 Tax=Stylosanthes scabra TaxID=79078 RepID=A0ABU6YJY0_9FABA|nr:hypothetical protein [Stylosanthes scabra]